MTFSFHLKMEPNTAPMSWREFCRNKPPNSIALDGYVADGPAVKKSRKKVWVNFNHHEGCHRLATRCTAAQALMHARMGFFDAMLERGVVGVYVNDCDEDVCASWYALSRYKRVKAACNPEVNRLFGVVDAMDTTSGMYPFRPDIPTLLRLAWIMEPYRAFRRRGDLDLRMDARAGYEGVVEEVCERFDEHLNGDGKDKPLELGYRALFKGTSWIMIEPEGGDAYVQVATDGHRAFVSVRQRHYQPGVYSYSLFRAHALLSFDVPALLKRLSAMERVCRGHIGAPWGGGDLCGGSNRAYGSILPPQKVFDEIERHVRRWHRLDS